MAPVVLVLHEPDLGTAAVFLPVLFVMLFVAGARRGNLAQIGLLGLLALPLLWTQMSGEQRSRVTALFEQTPAGEQPTDDTYQLYRAKRRLALGGWWGSSFSGPVTDDRAVYQLPEALSDFMFCVLGERFGVPGVGLVLGLYGLLLWRGMAIASATREPFARLVAAGVVALFTVEAVIHTAVNVGLMPVTGLSLPLVSYGGSGLVAHGIALGLLVNIAMRPGYEVAAEPFRYVVE
jgi:cell division protein FtsW (lipid II flippase)